MVRLQRASETALLSTGPIPEAGRVGHRWARQCGKPRLGKGKASSEVDRGSPECLKERRRQGRP